MRREPQPVGFRPPSNRSWPVPDCHVHAELSAVRKAPPAGPRRGLPFPVLLLANLARSGRRGPAIGDRATTIGGDVRFPARHVWLGPSFGRSTGSCRMTDYDPKPTWALPLEAEHWSLTTLREKLVKIGAKVVHHGRYATFRLAEVAVPRNLFRGVPRWVDELRRRPPPA
jgi:hypothetical protein